MKYHVLHNTQYHYTLPVISSQQLLRLKPRNLPSRQKLLSHQIELSISGTELHEQLDFFGNCVHEVRLHARHSTLTINASSEIDVSPRDELLIDLSPPWENVQQALSFPKTPEHYSAAQFRFPSPHVDVAAAVSLARQLATPGLPLLRMAYLVNTYIYEQFSYQGGVTNVHTEVADVLHQRVGVCQDFAHVAIAIFRALGLAARYVSGYILSQSASSRPQLVGAEATHAWMSIYCPEFGWIDFDPTNNLITSDQHITLGWGRDYADVAPTRGYILGGGHQSLSVDVRVREQETS
ncbi:MAG: transglutaminase family protein [Gammaproteobacteria bacterium]|nr:transglutaminase family protein [Gammaproteobacteria bacterium]